MRPFIGVEVSAAWLLDAVEGDLPDTAPCDFLVVTDSDAAVRGGGTPDARSMMVAARLTATLPELALIATSSVHTLEPYNLAREATTLDIMTAGRAGLGLQASPVPTSLAALGINYREDSLDPMFAVEAVEVIRGLWRSWEPDALVRDWETGRFVDREKVHPLHYSGAHLQILGPSGTPAGPQVEPPLVWVTDADDPYPAPPGVDAVISDPGTVTTADLPVVPRYASDDPALAAADAGIVLVRPAQQFSGLRDLVAVIPSAFTGERYGVPPGATLRSEWKERLA